jgi:hypothetical protein
MCIVTNHEENQAGLPFRVDSALSFVMSDVIFNVLVRDCRQCCPWHKARMVRSGRLTSPLPSTSRAPVFIPSSEQAARTGHTLNTECL